MRPASLSDLSLNVARMIETFVYSGSGIMKVGQAEKRRTIRVSREWTATFITINEGYCGLFCLHDGRLCTTSRGKGVFGC